MSLSREVRRRGAVDIRADAGSWGERHFGHLDAAGTHRFSLRFADPLQEERFLLQQNQASLKWTRGLFLLGCVGFAGKYM